MKYKLLTIYGATVVSDDPIEDDTPGEALATAFHALENVECCCQSGADFSDPMGFMLIGDDESVIEWSARSELAIPVAEKLLALHPESADLIKQLQGLIE